MTIIKKEHLYLPQKNFDLSKWAVNASDQFSNKKEYWENVKNYVVGSPTVFDMILPDAYFDLEYHEKIKQMSKNMQEYYKNNLFYDLGMCMVLVNRSTKFHKNRLGIVLNVDIEEFGTDVSLNKQIMPLEKNNVDRIPPKVEMRKDAIFEFPYSIVLYDDRVQNIAENLFKEKDTLEKLYSFNLNMGGGHLYGYKVKDADEVIKSFETLAQANNQGEAKKPLFLVAKGINSFATALEHWNNIKVNLSEEERQIHPARYMAVEAININSSAIEFKPVHRVVYNAGRCFVRGLKKLFKVNHKKVDGSEYATYKIIYKNKEILFDLPNNSAEAIKKVQDYIDSRLENKLEMSLDFVYDEEKVKDICDKNKKAVGIFMPTLNKNEVFDFVAINGTLPRKAFSIGEPEECRYQLEAHKIKFI